MLAVTPAKTMQSETAADICTDNDDESGLSTYICENETLTFTTGGAAPVDVNYMVMKTNSR